MGFGSKAWRRFHRSGFLLVGIYLFSFRADARELSFEQRVQAEQAIQRVYYSHQIGATRLFDEAVPRAVLEKKVRTYLKQSVVLEQIWKTPITAPMLRAEVARMQRQSRMPERLRELFAALSDDPFLIQECLARPALAARLAGNFFAFDRQIHAATRHLAESARADPAAHKSLVLVEERDDFVLRERPQGSNAADSLSSSPAVRRFPKTSMETWWFGVEGGLNADAVQAVGEDGSGDILPGAHDEPASPSCLTDNTWDNGSLDDFPYGRSFATAVWTGSLMVVWGGSVGQLNVTVNTGGRYDPATDTWLSVSRHNAPSERASHSAVWTGNSMIVWGGGNGLATGGRYDPVSDSWTPTSLSGAPAPRYAHSAVWTGSRMIVWGGYGGAFQNTGGIYDPSADTWSPTSTLNAPSPRYHHSAVWTGSEMIVWGGGSATGGRYNPSSDTWGPVSTVNAPTGGPTVWTGSLMLVLAPDSTTAGRRYDPGSNAWTPMSNSGAPALGRTDPTVIWTGSEMILWGGYSSVSDFNTGGRYNPSTDSWTFTSTLNAPHARSRHVAVWTGSRMVVWGGYDSLNFLDIASGGRFDPATDSWTPTSQSSAPSERALHTAVWTGNSMIVWGGVNSLLPGSGGRYDPVLDTWAPTSSVDAPAGRSGHTALWTGDSMVVWGGGNGTDVFSDGARYDPISDHWTATSQVGAPSGRTRHSAVWTGTKMIVWGGQNNTVRLNTGAIYDPIADTWTPTSVTGAPTARSRHLAVWTGSSMIIWGGPAGTNTGGRYEPATNTWTPTSTTNAPSTIGSVTETAVWTGNLMLVWGADFFGGRYDPALDQWSAASQAPSPVQTAGHSAVWTGSRMIIWGGGVLQDFGIPLYNTGGIYDPVADTWSLTSTEDAPSERAYHTAVWTGTFMLVWGGYGPGESSPILNNGGRLIFGQSIDDDGDGFTECGGDCNDASAAIHPGATEICNGVDDNCSGVADEGGGALCDDANVCTSDACTGVAGCIHPIKDADGDGHPDLACGGNDCNDANPAEWSVPAEIAGLTLTSPNPADPSWLSQAEAAGPGTMYDLVSGSLGPLAGIDFSSASCLQSATGTSYLDSRPGPSAGLTYWYLARAGNSCGTATYGSAPRDTSIPACP